MTRWSDVPGVALRRVPKTTRADIYRGGLAVGIAAATGAALADGALRVALFGAGNLLAIAMAALASANTSRHR